MVTKATIDPITAHVGSQGNPRIPGAKAGANSLLKVYGV